MRDVEIFGKAKVCGVVCGRRGRRELMRRGKVISKTKRSRCPQGINLLRCLADGVEEESQRCCIGRMQRGTSAVGQQANATHTGETGAFAFRFIARSGFESLYVNTCH